MLRRVFRGNGHEFRFCIDKSNYQTEADSCFNKHWRAIMRPLSALQWRKKGQTGVTHQTTCLQHIWAPLNVSHWDMLVVVNGLGYIHALCKLLSYRLTASAQWPLTVNQKGKAERRVTAVECWVLSRQNWVGAPRWDAELKYLLSHSLTMEKCRTERQNKSAGAAQWHQWGKTTSVM